MNARGTPGRPAPACDDDELLLIGTHATEVARTTCSPDEAPVDDAVVDDAVVAAVCRRIADRAGEPAALAAEEVRVLAPLHSPDQQHDLVRHVIARLSGLGELDVFLHDPDIDEVLVNAGREIWIDRSGTLHHVGTLDTGRITHLIERVLAPLGRRIDRTSPIVDARLPDGARVCAVLPPIAVDGPALSIRRFGHRRRPVESFTDTVGGTLLAEVVGRRCNVIVSGSTSSGKTSLLGALLDMCPPDERIVVVEDTTEIAVAGSHLVRLEARPAMADGPPPVDLDQLVRTALRLRPDRIVVGEIRGNEVVALVHALNTGHDGSLSTCHANGPVDALLRLESLVLRAAPSWPLAAIRTQLARSIDVVVHVARTPGSASRAVVAIDEVVANETDSGAGSGPATRPLARCHPEGGLERVGDVTRGRR